MRRLLPFALTMLAAPALLAQERAERFDYQVEWGYADIARVNVQRGCLTDGYRAGRLAAKSLGVIEQVHAFNVKLDTFVGEDGRTLEGRTFIEEEGISRRYRTRFAADGTALTQKTYKEKQSELKLAFRPGTYDLLSWFFALRDDVPTTARSYFVWDGWKLSRITASPGKLERVWTPDGTFSARRIDVTRVRLHHAAKKYEPKSAVESLGTLWLAEKTNLPVAMDFKAPVGLAKVRLVRTSSRACAASKK